jgi:hypothetical protein
VIVIRVAQYPLEKSVFGTTARMALRGVSIDASLPSTHASSAPGRSDIIFNSVAGANSFRPNSVHSTMRIDPIASALWSLIEHDFF